jgi:hypothetical protein
MSKSAEQVIETIKESLEDATREDIRFALEDGEALTALGFCDDDQEAIECAHDMISKELG